MFIRKTATRNKSTNEAYFTHRLVTSERTGKQVRQITLLNLGRHFDLPQHDWPRLCARIEGLLAGQAAMLAEPDAIEVQAQRLAARLIAAQPEPAPSAAAPPPPPAPPAQPQAPARPARQAAPDPVVYAEVDIAWLHLTRPRSVGVEAVGLAAMGWLGIDQILSALGLNGVQRDAVAGLLIGRMAAPGSERAAGRLRSRQGVQEAAADVPLRGRSLLRAPQRRARVRERRDAGGTTVSGVDVPRAPEPARRIAATTI